MRYVGGQRNPGCIFCNACSTPDDPESLVLHMGEDAFMLLNRYPYNSGHLMIVPFAHVSTLEDLTARTRAEVFEMSSLAMKAARAVLRCDGFNLGMNIGDVAGAGIADHLHMHLVPRWKGDANFMPILADTMVLPELLYVTHARLRAEIEITVAAEAGKHELAAGALVYAPELEKFVLRRSQGGTVTLPMGPIQSGETGAGAAMREVEEQIGGQASITGWLGSTIIDMLGDGSQSTQYNVLFLATAQATDEFIAQLDSDVVLVDPDELVATLDVPELRSVVTAAMPSIQQITGQSS